jgi:hypothetical protein
MAFLKKHYEKILLGLMLLGFIGVLVFMLFYIASDKDALAAKREVVTNPSVRALTNLDTTLQDSAILRAKSPYELDLETTNKVLNPMEWQRSMDNTLIPVGIKTGPQMAVVTNIVPLYTIISLDQTITNELGANYVIKVEHQAAPTPAKRAPARHYVSLGEKPNDVFALLSIKGAAGDPDGLVLKLADTGETVTISKEHPYRRIDGYMADFRYDPERKVFRGVRAGDKRAFGGVEYVVVDVNSNEVILADQINQKKTSLPFAP